MTKDNDSRLAFETDALWNREKKPSPNEQDLYFVAETIRGLLVSGDTPKLLWIVEQVGDGSVAISVDEDEKVLSVTMGTVYK